MPLMTLLVFVSEDKFLRERVDIIRQMSIQTNCIQISDGTSDICDNLHCSRIAQVLDIALATKSRQIPILTLLENQNRPGLFGVRTKVPTYPLDG